MNAWRDRLASISSGWLGGSGTGGTASARWVASTTEATSNRAVSITPSETLVGNVLTSILGNTAWGGFERCLRLYL